MMVNDVRQLGTGIIAAPTLQHVEHTPQPLCVRPAVDADAIPASDLYLDMTRDHG